tara:strand:- start:225 stop:473 length:249 start_codon:yes stop_codon:yes gene_type:complete
VVYYLLLKGDTNKDLISESNVLGEESFGKFYPSHGFEALHKIIHNNPELLSDSKIVTDMGKELTLTKFFDVIEKLKIQQNNT